MLRSFFSYLAKANWARKMVMGWSVAWRMASRFIAGETIPDAIRAIQALNQKGINATLDHLGESTATPEDARKAMQDILDVLDAIQRAGVRANVSIKLSQIGLNLDHNLCLEILEKILAKAKLSGNFIRIDMEDSAVTQITLDALVEMRKRGYSNVGVVIQSYLFRSDEDIKKLIEQNIPVRLCKGAYLEPASVAYPLKKDVDIAYDRLADMLLTASAEENRPRLSADGRFPPLPGLATHDEKRINHAKQMIEKLGLTKNGVEFQMLLGIRRELQEQLAKEGYAVRVYVPYGTEWYPYFMRRLAERPANVWFILLNFFRR